MTRINACKGSVLRARKGGGRGCELGFTFDYIVQKNRKSSGRSGNRLSAESRVGSCLRTQGPLDTPGLRVGLCQCVLNYRKIDYKYTFLNKTGVNHRRQRCLTDNHRLNTRERWTGWGPRFSRWQAREEEVWLRKAGCTRRESVTASELLVVGAQVGHQTLLLLCDNTVAIK